MHKMYELQSMPLRKLLKCVCGEGLQLPSESMEPDTWWLFITRMWVSFSWSIWPDARPHLHLCVCVVTICPLFMRGLFLLSETFFVWWLCCHSACKKGGLMHRKVRRKENASKCLFYSRLLLIKTFYREGLFFIPNRRWCLLSLDRKRSPSHSKSLWTDLKMQKQVLTSDETVHASKNAKIRDVLSYLVSTATVFWVLCSHKQFGECINSLE